MGKLNERLENRISNIDRHFYRQLLTVGVPVMLQQLVMVSVGLCDTLMVGSLGEVQLAAVGAANQAFYIYIDTMFGFLSGSAIFSVQYWGIRDLKHLRSIVGIGYAIVILVGIPFTFFTYSCAPGIISFFSKDAAVVAYGVGYIRITCFAYLISTLTYVISYHSRSVAILKWPTAFNAFAVVVNIFLNWCLIFGKCGLPEMGVNGAAVATLIARILEFLLTAGYVYIRKDHPLGARLSELGFSRELFTRVMKTAFPVIINEFLWITAFTTVFALYGKISATALAVVQVAMTVSDALQAVFFGLGSGCSVTIGQKLGQGDKDKAYEYAHKSIVLVCVFSVLVTTFLILTRGLIVSFYDFQPETNVLLMQTLFWSAVTMLPKMIAFLFICGILRPGGDTTWCAIVDSGLNWVLQVPMVWCAVVILKWPISLCYAVAAVSDAIKAVLCYGRYRTRKWVNVLTEADAREEFAALHEGEEVGVSDSTTTPRSSQK